jgi:hypothetical protein
MGRLRCDVG